LLGVIREQVRQRRLVPRQCAVLENGYQGSMGWRQARLLKLLRQSSESGPTAPPGEPQHQELLGLLDQEIARVREEFEYAEKVDEEKAALERDACLAPVGNDWRTLVRLEATLDRSIDRKVKILLALRKQYSDDPDICAAPAHLGKEGRMSQPSPLGRGCPAAGAFTSRSGTGEGFLAPPREPTASTAPRSSVAVQITGSAAHKKTKERSWNVL
jgi:hypothetical protein